MYSGVELGVGINERHLTALVEHDAFADDPWTVTLVEYVRQLLKQDRVRIIGVCFGHQILGRAMGVKVGRSSLGWEVSVSLVKLTEKGKELFKKDILVSRQLSSESVY